jgi:hypothetical protein
MRNSTIPTARTSVTVDRQACLQSCALATRMRFQDDVAQCSEMMSRASLADNFLDSVVARSIVQASVDD